jgi:type VI secretion system secreted protein VgrG
MAPPSIASLSLDHAANSSHFDFRIRSVPDDTFTVVGFKSKAHGLSTDFKFKINLNTDAELLVDMVVGSTATLEMRWGGSNVYLHGVVANFFRLNDTPDGTGYCAVINSPLYALKKNTTNRVFLNRTVPQILDEVLCEAGFAKEDFVIDLGETYPEREFVVQFGETDYDFITRLLSQAGIFFAFESDEEKTRPLFCDQSENRPSLPGVGALRFEAQSGAVRSVETIYSLRPRAQMKPHRVRVNDYNYRTPDTALDSDESSATGEGHGENAVYGDHFKTPEEGQRMALIRQQAHDARRVVFEGKTDCRGILPGYLLKIINHPQADMNGDYLVVNVDHQADQGAGLAYGGDSKGPTYANTVKLIKADVPYRPEIIDKSPVMGSFTGRVESPGSEYAHLDDQGRYRIRLDFDRGDAGPGEASHPVRLIQPYGGNKFGIHFPLQAGTEVALTYVNGDLDRPVMSGALSNPNTPSVVTSDNPSQNIIRTVSGNELLMDDANGAEKIELFTADRKNILTLDANKEGHKVRLATEEGKMEIMARKTLIMESGDTQTVQTGNDHIINVENSQQLTTRNKDIVYQAATDFKIKAGKNISMHAEKQDVEMTAGKDMSVDVTRGLSMETRQGDMSILVDKGNLDIKAAKRIGFTGRGGGPIGIGQRGGVLEITTKGDMAIEAGKISIKGKKINLKAGKISEN